MPEAPAKDEPGIEEGAIEPSDEDVRGIRAAVITAGRVVGHDVRSVVGSVIAADRSPPFATPVTRRRDSRQIFDDLLRDADLLQTDQIVGAGRRLDAGPPGVEEREDRRVGGSTGRQSRDLVENRTGELSWGASRLSGQKGCGERSEKNQSQNSLHDDLRCGVEELPTGSILDPLGSRSQRFIQLSSRPRGCPQVLTDTSLRPATGRQSRVRPCLSTEDSATFTVRGLRG